MREDDRPDSKYLMCLFHYSVSVKASARATVTLSAVLAVRSMALKRNSEEFIARGRFFADLHIRAQILPEADVGGAS